MVVTIGLADPDGSIERSRPGRRARPAHRLRISRERANTSPRRCCADTCRPSRATRTGAAERDTQASAWPRTTSHTSSRPLDSPLPARDVTARRAISSRSSFVPPLPVHPGDVLESENVLALIPGTDARLSRQIVVIGAHHDGQGRIGEADPGTGAAERAGPPARQHLEQRRRQRLQRRGRPRHRPRVAHGGVQLRRTVVFATFGGEEPGMQGSLYYVAHPPLPWAQHVAMFTMEQMGRHADMQPIAMDAGTSPSWPALFHRANVASGMHLTILSPEVIQDSDHYGFAVRGLPAVVFGVNHDDDIHLPSDEWEKFDFPAFTKRAQFALALLLELADMPDAPARAARPACHNGTRIENLDARCSSAYDPGLELAHLTEAERHAAGRGDGEVGLKVIVTVAGLAADRAGIAPGDILVAVDGRPLARDASLRVLHHAADAAATHAVDVVVIRQTARLRLTIAPVRPEPVPQ